MNNFKKIIRALALTLIIVAAACGAGIAGAFLPNMREKYMDKEIRIERVDKKRNDDSEEKEQE
ncbi:MAG: hypothetical protein JSS79_16555 [Bacteroidetes bacterium]|nr:hypothetical protein [Bacteroidota bacterium]